MLLKKLNCLRKSQKKFPALDLDRAGIQGERMARELLQKLLDKRRGRSRLFSGLRVPKMQGHGKYEIDLLLVSEQGILVIEVKHWGGSLSRQGQNWVQERNGERKTHPDPVKLNHEKLLALQHWLGQRAVRMPLQALHSVVLFTHPHVTFSADIGRLSEVMTLVTLPKIHLTSTSIPYTPVINTLEQLPTWDRVTLHGGRVLHGDVEELILPDIKPSLMQRTSLQSAIVHMSRRLFPGLFLTPKLQMRDWSGQSQLHPLHPSAKIIFRAAGQNRPEEISWLNIEALEFGWKDQSYYDKT